MKKLITTFLMCCATFFANAQNNTNGVYQFTDPGFEQYTTNGEPSADWNSFASATGKYTQAIGVDLKGQSPNPLTITPGAAQTSHALKLISKQITGPFNVKANANGNLTTGVINMGAMNATDPANHNRTLLNNDKHNLRFAGRPDLVTFYAKFKAGSNNKGKCGNANFILHDRNEYQDPEIASQNGQRIGKANTLIHESADWEKYEIAFKYDREPVAEQYLLASITTNPTPGESIGDELCIDEIYFVYYHALSSLSYDGASISFDENTLTYDLSSVSFTPNKLHYNVKGAGAKVEENFNTQTNILTITVKGSDFSQNPQNVTTYEIQFGEEVEEPVENLEQEITALDQIDINCTYALYNEHFTAYACFNPDHTGNIWTKNMTGDESHQVASTAYSQPFDISSPNDSWMVIPTQQGKYYLYNLGAKKFLKTPGYHDKTTPCTFSTEPVALTFVSLGNGNFAFTATEHPNDFFCAAPANPSYPLSIWEKSDTGAAWKLKKNPNVQADPAVAEQYYTPKMGNKVTALSQIDLKKAYVLRNAHYTAYAVYAPEHSQEIVWTAEMTGDDKDHALKHPEFGEKANLMRKNSNWMVIPQDGFFYLYNIGAKKYLSTPINTEENKEKGCFFSAEPVKMYIEDLGDGKFAFTSSNDPKDYMCAAPQLNTPISNWEKTDPGAAWELTENLDVAADPSIVDQYEVFLLGEKVNTLSQVSLQKAYVLHNETYAAYAIYAPKYSADNLWTAEMKGDKDHQLKNPDYAAKIKLNKENSSWMVIPQDDCVYLFNLGAKKYLSSPIETDKAKGCFFTTYPVKLYTTELGNGKFAFTTSQDSLDYICASPQLDVPISNWSVSDAGAAWNFIENPNVSADASITEQFTIPTLGKRISQISQLSKEKTYILRNKHFTAYAVYAPEHSLQNVWAASMVGDLSHPLNNASYFKKVDVKNANSSWMILSKDNGFYIYNMGAKQYLTIAGNTYNFSAEPMKLFIEQSENGNFKISATTQAENVMCATPQAENAPVANGIANEPGANWEIIECPYVAADPNLHTEEPGTALLTDLRYNGSTLEGFDKNVFEYTLTGAFTDGCITYTCEDGDKATATISYNANNQTATINVVAQYGDATHSYKVKFVNETPDITNYYGKMVITMNGQFVAESQKPIGISAPKNGLVNLQLLDFELEGMGNIGNIYITDVPYEPDTQGNVTLYKEQEIVIDGEVGAGLGKLPTTLEGQIVDGQLTCTISISWNGIPIIVKVTPNNTKPTQVSTDLTDVKYNGVTIENFDKSVYEYSIEGTYSDGCITFTCEDQQNTTATVTYDAATTTATITVEANNKSKTSVYTIKFTEKAPSITNYYGKMVITMNGQFVAESQKPIGISAPKNGLVNLQLLDFELEGMGNIGNIYITDVPYEPDTQGNVTLYKEQEIVIDGEIGAGLGKLPTTLEGQIVDGQLTCTISISWNGIPIIVKVTPITVGITDVEASTSQKVSVYSFSGKLIRHNVSSASALKGLPSGIYIVNGKKFRK